MVLFHPCAIKKSLVGSKWGSELTRPPSGPGATLPTSSRRTAFCRVPESSSCVQRGDRARGTHSCTVDRMSYWPRDNRDPANAVLRLERGEFGNDCVIDGFLQFHTFENMTLKVKRTRPPGRVAPSPSARR